MDVGIVARPTDPNIVALHKYAFRTAYEFLNEMWPPADGEDYWTLAASRMKDRFNDAKQDYLAEQMLTIVYKYLEEVVKQEKAKDEC